MQDFTFSLPRVALTESKGLLESRGPSKITTNKNEKISLSKTDQFIKNVWKIFELWYRICETVSTKQREKSLCFYLELI